MHVFVQLADITLGQTVIPVTDCEHAIESLCDQIANEGIDTSLLAYESENAYVVVDDRLRFLALHRLARQERLPPSISQYGVPLLLLKDDRRAFFTAADRFIRAQLSPAAEALYLKRLFEALSNAPPNVVGGRGRCDGRRQPEAQQPGKTGILRLRYQMLQETARQAVRRSEVPEDVLMAYLDHPRLTKRALTAAGTAINRNPQRNPSEVARETLAAHLDPSRASPKAQAAPEGQGAHATSMAATPQTDGPSSDNADTDTSSADSACNEDQANTVGRKVESDPAKTGEELAMYVNQLSKDERELYLKHWSANLTDEAKADVLRVFQTMAPVDAPQGDDDRAAAAETGGSTQPDSAWHVEDRETPDNGAQTSPDATTGGSDAGQPAPSECGQSDAGSRAENVRTSDGGALSAEPVSQDRAGGAAHTTNPSLGQSNAGPSGGSCSEDEAEDLRAIVGRIWRYEGSLKRVAARVGVGPGSLDRLMKGSRVSRKNARLIFSQR